MQKATTQSLFEDDANYQPKKDSSKVKYYIIIGISIVVSLLLGALIGYFAFGRKSKTIETVKYEVVYGDFVSEITDPMDSYVLIDVRNQTEWEEMRIGSAILIPVYEIQEKIGNYVQNKSFPIKVFCKSGVRAAKSKEKLLLIGYNNVVNLGGIQRASELIKNATVIKL